MHAAGVVNSTKPPPKKSRSRKWLRRIGVVLLLIILILVAMPVWLPWIVIPALEGQGVSIGSYRRQGVNRLQLNGVEYSNASAALKIDQLSVQFPHRWLMDRFGLSDDQSGNQVEADGWDLTITPSTNQMTPSTTSLHRTLDQTVEILNSVRPWLRNVSIDDGIVVIGRTSLDLRNVSLAEQQLTAEVLYTNLPATAQIQIGFPDTNAFELNLSVPELSLTNALSLSRAPTEWAIAGETDWRGNVATLSGALSNSGWLPRESTVSGTNWVVSADTVGLDGYDALRGSFDVGWTNEHYVFQLNGEAFPSIDNALLPDRIDINIGGQGTLESLALETLNITTPALFAELSGPLAIDFAGRMLVPETTLTVSANFIPEDLLPFTGKLEGTVTARPDTDEVINADFQATVNQFDGFGLRLDTLDLEGALRWPSLIVSHCSFTFPDAGTFTMNGNLNLLTQEAADFTWAFSGAIPANLTPQDLRLDEVDASGKFDGIWPTFIHDTRIQIGDISRNEFRVDSLQLRATGNTRSTNDFVLSSKRGGNEVEIEGNVDISRIDDRRVSGQFRSFDAKINEQTSLRLVDPAEFSAFVGEGSAATNTPQFSLSIDPMVFSGSEKHLALSADVHWPQSGQIALLATNLNTSDLSEFPLPKMPLIQLEKIELKADWDAGPISFNGEIHGNLPVDESDTVGWDIEVSGDEHGVVFAPSQFGFNKQPVVAIEGKAPVTARFERDGPILDWSESEEFQTQISMLPAEAFWREVEQRYQVRIVEPELQLSARGDLKHFQSELKLNVASIRPLMITNVPVDLVTVTNLAIHATASPNEIRIDEGGFVIGGSPSVFAARIPLEVSTWEEWFTKLKELDWKDVSGSLQVPAIQVGALGEVTQNALRSSGSAGLFVKIEQGGKLNGSISLTNIATRPIEPIGSIRDIQGTIQFDDRTARLNDLQATINGEKVRLGGGLSWNEDGLGEVDVTLVATNITLVRSVDLFLRGDLDLHVQSDGTNAPTVSGDVALHNSLLFQDIGNLLAVNLNRPETRPPFFSFPQEPFANWGLDVRVRGQEFLRVLSPVFKGRVSTGMQLGGTLREPIAIGDVSIEKGRILFPFGSLDVRQGSVQLTREEPHRPKVDFRGQGMNFGYNVTIDVTGGADAPNIVFNSVPPLTTREIVLMLTAGEIPSGDYNYSDVDKASKLGYFLGKELINQLFGMDTGEDKLLFRTGEYVTDDGQLTYRIEYKLINWLGVFGEYTRFRDYNGGLKFNIYSR